MNTVRVSRARVQARVRTPLVLIPLIVLVFGVCFAIGRQHASASQGIDVQFSQAVSAAPVHAGIPEALSPAAGLPAFADLHASAPLARPRLVKTTQGRGSASVTSTSSPAQTVTPTREVAKPVTVSPAPTGGGTHTTTPHHTTTASPGSYFESSS
jgi:hypothetical protein